MEKVKGRVRNYVVSNKEIFCDHLAKMLCDMQVQYVQVDNEFHFDDKICRFYNFDECVLVDGKLCFVDIDKTSMSSLCENSLLDVKNNDFDIELGSKKSKKSYMKKMIKHNNSMVNQKIKQSYRQPGFKNRHNG